MSPEPDAEQLACNKFVAIEKETDVAMEENLNNLGLPTDSGEICQQTDEALPRKQRERRNKSPIAISTLMESFAAPLSPASSSCTSQGNSSADATFEPSIDMMVNDFDDEQTLNEEEALAAMEHQDPHDEIATLQEESEMPLEELLAKYQVAPQVPVYVSSSRKKKRTAGSGKNSKHRKVDSESTVGSNSAEAGTETALESIVDNEAINSTDRSANDVILIEESGDEEAAAKKSLTDMGDNDESLTPEEFQSTNEENNDTLALNGHTEKSKQRRTHLMDLYPEESFTAVINSVGDQDKDISLELLYNEEIEEDIIDAEEEEEDEFDSDYVKKTIMVGSSYQATIPDGLSQYGDVLPYENEDKLIWEPSQVSEKEVEEYLLKARDIKPSLLDNVDEECEEPNQITPSGNADSDATNTVINGIEAENAKSFTNQKTEDTQSTMTSLAGENVDVTAVIKDNEQALHLLVQCGYDFKEALRRKRLNALPLTGSMSLWSEEECHKFEEGIQKFGKDFLKIRQNQASINSNSKDI
ncbi:unnamed protein product [Ceratitis capitata]|uniref:(Mediterranean fruit fly) hypothetical protein n=1 Tax=Ceratitis capitata TaxID=7213 RepID=W8C205_CERCA|nr:unnamed protein product [Ceratitis capitata]